MNRLIPSILVAVIAATGFALNAQAADASCAELKFIPAVYERWPDANDRCLEIVTRDNGKVYARFEAEVVQQSPTGTYVRWTLRQGGRTDRVRADPPAGLEAILGGKPASIDRLVEGQKVNMYLPESSWAQPEVAAAPMAVAPPPEPAPAPAPMAEPEPEPAPMMPTTAGNLGWLAILGGLFLLLGGALRFTRQ